MAFLHMLIESTTKKTSKHGYNQYRLLPFEKEFHVLFKNPRLCNTRSVDFNSMIKTMWKNIIFKQFNDEVMISDSKSKL